MQVPTENGTQRNQVSSNVINVSSFNFAYCQVKMGSIYEKETLLRSILVDLTIHFAVAFCISTVCKSLIIAKFIPSLRSFNVDDRFQTNVKQMRMYTNFHTRHSSLFLDWANITAEGMIGRSVDSQVAFIKSKTLFRIFNLLFYMNSGSNLILYCLLASEFRKVLIDILSLKK